MAKKPKSFKELQAMIKSGEIVPPVRPVNLEPLNKSIRKVQKDWAQMNYDILTKMISAANERGDKVFSNFLSEKTAEMRKEFKEDIYKCVSVEDIVKDFKE